MSRKLGETRDATFPIQDWGQARIHAPLSVLLSMHIATPTMSWHLVFLASQTIMGRDRSELSTVYFGSVVASSLVLEPRRGW